MSDTPRTDAIASMLRTHQEWMTHAEELERELAKAKAALAQAHKDYGFELRDPNGTIWEHAAKLQRELVTSKQREDVLTQDAERWRAHAAVKGDPA